MIDKVQPRMNNANRNENDEQPQGPFQFQCKPMVIRREEVIEDEETDVCHGASNKILLCENRNENGQDHF